MRRSPGKIALVALALLAAGRAAAREPKPEKIPIAMGSWTGPHAGAFKSAVRSGVAKECRVVGPKAARVIVDGTVAEKGKGVVVTVIVKQPKSGEVLERRDFEFLRPTASKGQAQKMGRMVTEAARRAPTDAPPSAP